MIVYHGTSLSRWNLIQTSGVAPRGKTGKTNWAHSVESNPDTVYVTNAYALLFALNAIKGDATYYDKAVIIEIDTKFLDQDSMVPDEGALEQVSRGQDGLDEWSMEERTRHYRKMTKMFAKAHYDFEWSMKKLGTAGYIGTIPLKAITRVAIIDVQKAAELSWVYMGTQVTVMNYRFLGARMRSISQSIFNDSPNPEDEKDPLAGHVRAPTIGPGITILKIN